MEILQSKNLIMDHINIIFKNYEDYKEKYSNELKEYASKLKDAHIFNKRLIQENSEKDKLLILSEQKMVDYESMINQIQEEANKELSEKERFNMLKAQDKEIHIRDIEIKKLQKEINILDKKNKEFLERINTMKPENTEKIYKDNWKNRECNSLYKNKEKLKIAIHSYSEHIKTKDITAEMVGMTSIGINGWYYDYINNKDQIMNGNIIEQDNNIQETIEETPGQLNEDISSLNEHQENTSTLNIKTINSSEITESEPSPYGSIDNDNESIDRYEEEKEEKEEEKVEEKVEEKEEEKVEEEESEE